MPTIEEVQAKIDATRLKNLPAKKADKKPLSQSEKAILKTLKAKASKATAPRKRAFSQNAWDVAQRATGAKSDWLAEPASPQWTGRKIKNKGTGREYVIGDVFGELHVEMERDAKTTIRTAAAIRQNYEPC